MMNRKVKLKGHGTFWFLEEPRGGGALARLSECTKKGQLKTPPGWDEYALECLLRGVRPKTADSYAHVFEDGTIRRYGKVIGHRDDLTDAGDEP